VQLAKIIKLAISNHVALISSTAWQKMAEASEKQIKPAWHRHGIRK